VLEFDDLEDRPVDLDVVAVLELVGAQQRESVLMEPAMDVVENRIPSIRGPRLRSTMPSRAS
jgi:hypothetical protein